MDDLIQEFLVETNESLSALDVDIVKLEQNPNNKDLLSKIFRLVHTVKGTCGFLGLPRLEKVAHHAENVLGRFRDGDLEVTPDAVSLILASFDRIKTIVAGIEQTGSEPQGDDANLIERLDAVYKGTATPTKSPAAAPVVAPLPAADKKSAESAAPAPAAATTTHDQHHDEDRHEHQTHDAVGKNSGGQKSDGGEAKEVTSDAASKSLRVNVDVLENLMTMVSELVLTRNQLLQILRTQGESEFSAPLQRLNQVVSELQEGVMQTRMQPIGNAWGKLPRIIRDISVELGKKINLDMRGQETELDRQVLDMIKDPLTHMVRNSADHGIEKPAERLAAGKPEEGHVLLNAFHEGGHIIIEISDDGKGLPTDRIKKKILEKNLATEEQLAAMSEKQIQQYIFHAGFSTAEKVTSVSGRGVGMDVVKTNIEKIGGAIEMRSILGKGTTFTIKIPLTLAIVSSLIVESAGERYAIPQISVRELVRVAENSEHQIESIRGAPVLRLRDRLLPLVSLSKLLKLGGADRTAADDSYVIVTQVGTYTFGIMVDRVFDTEEIVVKPVAPILKGIKLFAGNTILGDGSVIMILDPNGIANASGEMREAEVADFGAVEEEQTSSVGERKVSLLVFRAGDGAQKAVPLSLVSRLEEVSVDDIETSGHQKVVQYRGQLMPLILFSKNMQTKAKGRQAVLVFSDQDRMMGLMVDEIVDIVEEQINVQISGNEAGLLGSAIIDGKAMDVIDVGYFLGLAHSDWFRTKTTKKFSGKVQKRRILLVDDSPFFRNMLGPILTVAGYDVTSVSSADDALSLSMSGEHFDAIVSDIEMPGISGFDFAEKVKAPGSIWKDVPLVALSSHATQQDLDRGRTAGFDDYVAKFDRDALLRAIEQTLDPAHKAINKGA